MEETLRTTQLSRIDTHFQETNENINKNEQMLTCFMR